MKVLIVEDDPPSGMALRRALASLGHEVVAASDGEEAWAALADRTLRLVVSDWRLPRLDGLDLCRRIRAQREDYVSFILVTHEPASEAHLGEAFVAGVDNFLTKPVKVPQLELCLHVAARILDFTSEIKRLQSFLPICAYCKKVRDDRQYWQQIEAYINERMGTRFSHGICPECYEVHVAPAMAKLDAATD
jgi:sigma-B regulation protein RsbU (phosphoserine phosphatase)